MIDSGAPFLEVIEAVPVASPFTCTSWRVTFADGRSRTACRDDLFVVATP
ncbi:hypothetical protein [Rhodococcus rhodnii]|uniref:Uncharacterized protein n=1 Tax=Rhodococcus rhodnii LMG 5362 TaxID=1273125 RepID=R7WQQ9_9NOCA|nr:hypothetical protein [Rhodococcus rhodnii]EOM77657.1 hypothetical protein Rrhod_0976 [Rhodococcus rhodnii LMG 5362]